VSTFLLDANLSPQTAAFLRETLGLDVVHQRDVLPGSPTDDEMVALAVRERRVIITFDTDFGEIHHFRGHGTLGVIQLQLRNQTVEAVNRVLARFFTHDAAGLDLDHSLVTIEEHQVRVLGLE
jgi:predicted nuclease of predicted toxin-antitoxin system